MERFSKGANVFYWEEPVYRDDISISSLSLVPIEKSNITVVTPHLVSSAARDQDNVALSALLDAFLVGKTGNLICWYYTPMMLPFSVHVAADCIVYDCMDELSNFKDAPPELLANERQLLDVADVVFTGGHSLYEAKRGLHANIHPFPSSVDTAHFAAARLSGTEPSDQAGCANPRLGYYGVIDERLDLALLASIADARPEWSIVMVGPVVKIAPEDLPVRQNIHFLGGKSYAELPDYLRDWDVALMPFAINAATRFISPTKTPEYLAAGCPVVSTPVADVVRQYAAVAGVRIAATADEFVTACEAALPMKKHTEAWLAEVDALLGTLSWDTTFSQMKALVDQAIARRPVATPIRALSAPLHQTPRHYDVMIVGAGFAGSVMAERLAKSGKSVLVLDRRPHVAGNAYDRLDDAGVLIHQYGPHIFHTNSADVFDYLSRFTTWHQYEHKVLAQVGEQLLPVPINRTTLNMLYGLALQTDEDAAAFLASNAEPVDPVRTSEDVVVSAVGRHLYETFFRGYTRKQWGLDPSELDKSVTARVPTRTNTDDRYFADRFQAMPAEGYTRMFERMLDHPNIDVVLGVDYRDVRDIYSHDHLVFTGPIDEYFGHRYGKLPYRSLRFQHETLDCEWSQPVAVVNYPDEAIPYTRITEYKHLTGQVAARTSITREFPAVDGDPYYPIPREENQQLYKRYEALAIAETNVTFVGRLATYRYYNMDQVVGQALAAARRLLARNVTENPAAPAQRGSAVERLVA